MSHTTLATYRPELEHRLASLSATDQALWGRMSVHQMLCHLADAFRLSLGERSASPATGLLQRTLVKRLALYTPMPWPHGTPTRPELDQYAGGTPPTHFDQDRSSVLLLVGRLAEAPPSPPLPHPIFGPMTSRDWSIWAYRHTDHHLRQFGRQRFAGSGCAISSVTLR